MKWVAITLLLLNGIYLAIQMNTSQPSDNDSMIAQVAAFNGPRLILQAEKEKLASAQTAESAGQQATTGTSVSAQRVAPQACYSVGPFPTGNDADAVASVFARADIIIKKRDQPQRSQAGYWVYIPPLASVDEAQSVLNTIRGQESRAKIIAEGNKANAISVGIYKTEDLGKAEQQRLREMGYQARLEPLFRAQSQYWLELALMKNTQIPNGIWRQVKTTYPQLKQLRHKCQE